MQLTINTAEQNPTFGHFAISNSAKEHFKSHLKPNQLDKFTKIIEKEAENNIVEAIIGYSSSAQSLYSYLRIFNSKNVPISEFCRDLGMQGLFSKIIDGPIGYLEKVSKASSKMLEKYNISKQVDEIINL